MDRALWIAKTGLDSQQTRMAVVSNNLANVSTTGFKRGRAVFEDLIYQNVRQAGGPTSENTMLPSGLSLGSGVKTVATQKIFQQGNLINTENAYDVAIQGRGFLQIQMPDGATHYTRDGSFQVDAQGRLVTALGYPVLPGITIPADVRSVTIGADGIVSVLIPGAVAPQDIGQIQLADFVNVAGLQPIGNNLFQETLASGAPRIANPGLEGMGTLLQGSLESSNVNVAEELVNMIETQRAYEMNSKAISTTDEMLRYVSNNL
ncbi:MAG: flagellar basal-body rod protein FlgG [Gammaproteobacteria bacterium]|nr:flagellar basal-body rod protein FlgG [Gammaproteobacteria bacterium]